MSKTNMQQLVSEVRKSLTTAMNDAENVVIFLDRYAGIDHVNATNDGLSIGLAGTPHWEILTVRPSIEEVFINGEFHTIEEITDDILSDAVAEAIAERDRFYSEREEVFGETAWPKGCAAVA